MGSIHSNMEIERIEPDGTITKAKMTFSHYPKTG